MLKLSETVATRIVSELFFSLTIQTNSGDHPYMVVLIMSCLTILVSSAFEFTIGIKCTVNSVIQTFILTIVTCKSAELSVQYTLNIIPIFFYRKHRNAVLM